MPNLAYIHPMFIVENLQAAVAFYVDKLGFEIRYIGPEDGPYFAMVGRENISIMLKGDATDPKPAPNHTFYWWARLDAFIYANDPDALYEEFSSKGVTFHQPLKNDSDNLRGFEVMDADGYVLFFGKPVND